MAGDRAQRVVVVTGGAMGIGAAIAQECGRRGAFVVTMDPVVTLDGSPESGPPERTTAERIVDAGGAARASSTSVTDEAAVRALFTGLVEEFGALDAVVNVAGISRPTGFSGGTDEDWARVLDVHLNGYLTVLRVALPLMAAAGHGRIVGVTSGSGWRAADAGAYSCAKRAVASLTWQIGRTAPPGVTVNALSPIAATRMVANALARAGTANPSGQTAASGGVALGAAPPPEHLGPITAYLASEEFAWCSGAILFSNGAEVSAVDPPHLLEAVRTTEVASVAGLLDTTVPSVLVPAETAQASTGGSVPRVAAGFDDRRAIQATGLRCLLVTDDDGWAGPLGDALAARGITVVTGDAGADTFAAAAATVDAAAAGDRLDAVVVALMGPGATHPTASDDDWQTVLDAHAGIAEALRRDACWTRAAADLAARVPASVRVVTVTAATSAGGRSRAMAAAQLARAAHGATQDRVDAFSIAVESPTAAARTAASALAGHLVVHPDAAALSGAELVVDAEWVGLRSHPRVAGTVTYGGPDLPEWIDEAVRRIVGGEHRARGEGQP
jgi:NAD(P)-dependent dehydrogenase (short-subunit alcohol dehydrogenase family)